jgi:glycosyltransferase involved in cell wall biosynthesis
MTPRTSVIIPVRNGERFVAEAIASVLRQLAHGDEVVVVDDASTDDTRSLLARIQDRRMRVVNGLGRGVSSARNIGLTAAVGKFIAFLDHDDLWPPQRHAVLLQAVLVDVDIDCAIGRLRLRMESDAIVLPQLSDMEGRLAPNLQLGMALFRRRIIDKVGSFDEDMRYCEDTDYFLRLMECGYRTVLCDVDALIYRRHSTNATCNIAGAEEGMMQMLQRRRARMAGQKSGG